MIKIRLYDTKKHRNETTFRPYLAATHLFEDVGIQFTDGSSYDLVWVGQASVVDKTISLEESVARGVELCQTIGGPFVIVDGQDSHSLIGVYEVMRHMNDMCILLMKNTLLVDFDMYTIPRPNGRWYWNFDSALYSIQDIHLYSHKIVLSGTNWLSTVRPSMYDYSVISKPFDVSALFGSNLTTGSEHGVDHHIFYNAHRKLCIDSVSKMSGRSIQMLNGGQRLSPDQYYSRMAHSKIIVAPFGYGEIAPRDIEAAAFGSVLVKPDMSHIRTIPNIYDETSYVACKHDYSDLAEIVDQILSNYKYYQQSMVEAMRSKFLEEYKSENLVRYVYELLLSKLSNVVTHED